MQSWRLCGLRTYQTITILKRATTVEFTTVTPYFVYTLLPVGLYSFVNILGVSLCGNGGCIGYLIKDENANASPKTNGLLLF
jgi:hypothetical protein